MAAGDPGSEEAWGIMADETIQQEDEVDRDGEDSHEKTRDGATIIRLRSGRLDIEVFPALLAEHAGIYRGDAAKVCARGDGIIVDNVDIDKAKALAKALQEHGEDCFVVPASSLVSLPRAKPIHAAHLTRPDLGPVDAAGNRESASWKDAIVLAMAGVRVEASETQTSPDGLLTRRLPYVGVGGAAGIALGVMLSPGGDRQTVKKSATHTFLDIVFRDPLRRYRIEARQFDYSILGKQLQASSAANIRTLARWFLHAAHHMRTHFDTDHLMATGQVRLPSLSVRQFHNLVHWLMNLVYLRDEGTAAEGK